MGRRKKADTLMKDYGTHIRVSRRFQEEMNKINSARLKEGMSGDRVPTVVLTHVLTRHKLWPMIAQELIKLPEEQVMSLYERE